MELFLYSPISETQRLTFKRVLTGVISYVWTDRFYTWGDAKIRMSHQDYISNNIFLHDWILRGDSESIMRVDTFEQDEEDPNYIYIGCRSLEAYGRYRHRLRRQNNIEQPEQGGNFYYQVENFVNNVMNWPRLRQGLKPQPNPDPLLYTDTYQTHYDFLTNLCGIYGFGWRVKLSSSDTNAFLEIDILRPLNRTSDVIDQPLVEDRKNLMSPRRYETSEGMYTGIRLYSNRTVVAEGYRDAPIFQGFFSYQTKQEQNTSYGQDWRTVDSEINLLKRAAQNEHQKLENRYKRLVDGKVDPLTTDIDLGYVVDVRDFFGRESRNIVTEITHSYADGIPEAQVSFEQFVPHPYMQGF